MPAPPCSTIAFSSPAAFAAVRVVRTTKNPSRANFWAMAPPTPHRMPTGKSRSSSTLPCASFVLRPSACHFDVAPTTTAICFPAEFIVPPLDWSSLSSGSRRLCAIRRLLTSRAARSIVAPMTDLRATALAFDLKRLDAAFLDDPFPVYRALREHDPVHRMPDGSYFLSRYDDCAAVYRDPDTWTSDKTVDFRPNLGDTPLYEHHTTSLVFNDPPYHTRVRKLLAPAFTPRALMALQSRIEALVDRLLDRAADRGGMDLIADFAAAVPIQLVGDMLGVPESERGPLRDWSLAILSGLEPVLTAEQRQRGDRAVGEFKAYLRDLIDRRERAPTHDEGEILSKLTAGSALGTVDSAGERLSEVELLHNCIFLLNAGHETTTNLIGNAVDLLLRQPDALAGLRAEPGLIGTAVEEFLRLESSNQLGNRRA